MKASRRSRRGSLWKPSGGASSYRLKTSGFVSLGWMDAIAPCSPDASIAAASGLFEWPTRPRMAHIARSFGSAPVKRLNAVPSSPSNRGSRGRIVSKVPAAEGSNELRSLSSVQPGPELCCVNQTRCVAESNRSRAISRWTAASSPREVPWKPRLLPGLQLSSELPRIRCRGAANAGRRASKRVCVL
jgi:hypothetical protein